MSLFLAVATQNMVQDYVVIFGNKGLKPLPATMQSYLGRMEMNKVAKVFMQAMMLTIATAGVAMATPATQIRIPSTDVQAFGTFHLGIDNYLRASGAANPNTRAPNIYDIGPVAGMLPFEKVQAEIAFDYLRLQSGHNPRGWLEG